MNEINKKIAKGAAWMVSYKIVDRSIGLLSTIMLARLLMPGDFGLVAIAMVLIAALQLLGGFGFDIQLIQDPDAGRDQFDTAWTFNVLFSLSCGVILTLLANSASQFYREPRLEAVIYALALTCAVQGFSNIGTVIFLREMRFDREFKLLLCKRLSGLLITIPLAFWLRNYWALVLGQLSAACISVALSYVASEYRPRFSLKARSQLFHASKWLLANHILGFLNGRSAEVVIGRFAGATALGIYTVSSEVSSLPTTELIAPINRAAFPGYARVAHDIDQLRNSFLNVISMIALIALPASIGIVSVADLLIPTVLGWQWQTAIPLVQVLAIYGVIVALQTNINYVYLAVGRPRMITVIAACQFIVLMLLLLPSVWYYGAIGAAWAFLGTAILMLPVNQALVAKQLSLSLKGYGMKLWRPLVAAGTMAAAVALLKANLSLPHRIETYFFSLLLCVLLGAAVYCSVLYGLWRLSSRPDGSERFCLSIVERVLLKCGLSVNLVGS